MGEMCICRCVIMNFIYTMYVKRGLAFHHIENLQVFFTVFCRSMEAGIKLSWMVYL